MKKTLIIIGLFLAFGLNAQWLGTTASSATASSGGASYSDDFNSYSDGTALAGQSFWLSENGSIDCSGGTHIDPSSADEICLYYSEAVTDDQWAEISVDGGSSRYLGVALRVDVGSNNYYYLYSNGGTLRFGRVDSGTPTDIGTHFSLADANLLKLEVVGDEFTVYLDGVIDTGMSGGTGVFTDATYSTGKIGLAGQNSSGVRIGDNWSGGDL